MRTDAVEDDDLEDEEVVVPEAIAVKLVGQPTERDDSADYSSTQTYEVLGAGAAGGASPPQQILGRNDKRLQAVITVYDASGNGAGVLLCDSKQANSGVSGVGMFVPTGTTITWKGKGELWALPSTIKSNAGDVYVGVADQHYKLS